MRISDWSSDVCSSDLALSGLESAKAAKIRDAIRMGFVEGQTIDEMVRTLRGTKAAGYADGLLEISRRDAAAVVRTAVNHTGNYAREALYAEKIGRASCRERVCQYV